jgi:hypothetical protein
LIVRCLFVEIVEFRRCSRRIDESRRQTLRAKSWFNTERDINSRRAGFIVIEERRVLTHSQQFGNLFNAYSKAINKAYGRTGSLFEHPFERIEVTSESHLFHLVTYIHRNPQMHGLIADFREWPFSSYHALCSTRPTYLRRDDVLAWFGGSAQLAAAHRRSDDDQRLAVLRLEDFE